jgi:hypothetical protein
MNRLRSKRLWRRARWFKIPSAYEESFRDYIEGRAQLTYLPTNDLTTIPETGIYQVTGTCTFVDPCECAGIPKFAYDLAHAQAEGLPVGAPLET